MTEEQLTPLTTMSTSPVTYKADWTRNDYTITFNVDGGSVIASITGKYGDPILVEAPTKPGYTFAGWDPELPETIPDSNLTVKAKWNINKYTVTFVDEDGTTVLKEATEYDYGTTANDIVEPADPTKAADAQYTYTFAGWDTIPETVTANVVVKATYSSTLNKYTVTFVDEDGTTVLKAATEYEYGTAASGIAKPDDPTKAADAQYTYEFAGWNPAVAEVTADATYTATYTSTVNKYTITFVDEDDTPLQSSEVAYGEMPVYTGETPTKAATARYTYTFAGWDSDIVAVT
jgi:uncharacterized repeat protein (TIGR02543 family)